MGHGSSKDSSSSSSSEEGERSSRLSALANKLHIHGDRGSRCRRIRSRLFRRSSTKNDSSSSAGHGLNRNKLASDEDFAGIALLTLISAEMKFKDKWLACVSLGEQTFRTEVSDQTDTPVWNSEKKLLLEKNGSHIVRISVFETNRLSKNSLIGYCEIDLLEFLIEDFDSGAEVFDLLDPSSSDIVVGKISLSCNVEDPIETEKNFARRILSIVDYNEDGLLSFPEFSDLIKAFGNKVADDKVRLKSIYGFALKETQHITPSIEHMEQKQKHRI